MSETNIVPQGDDTIEILVSGRKVEVFLTDEGYLVRYGQDSISEVHVDLFEALKHLDMRKLEKVGKPLIPTKDELNLFRINSIAAYAKMKTRTKGELRAIKVAFETANARRSEEKFG